MENNVDIISTTVRVVLVLREITYRQKNFNDCYWQYTIYVKIDDGNVSYAKNITIIS